LGRYAPPNTKSAAAEAFVGGEREASVRQAALRAPLGLYDEARVERAVRQGALRAPLRR